MTKFSFLTWIEVSYLCAFVMPFFMRHPLLAFAASLGTSLALLGTGFLASGAIVNPEHDKTYFILIKNILAWEGLPFVLAMAGTTLSWLIKRGFDFKILKRNRFIAHDGTWTLWGIPFVPADVFWSLIAMGFSGLLISCLGSFFYFTNIEYFNRVRQERIAKSSASIAKRLSFSLPQKVDDEASLQKVSANKLTLNFYYNLNRKVLADEGQKVLQDRRQKIMSLHCANPSIEKVLRMGGTFRFHFTDVRGSEVGNFVLSREECIRKESVSPRS